MSDYELIFLPEESDTITGGGRLYGPHGSWFEITYHADSGELWFFDRRTPHGSETEFAVMKFPFTATQPHTYTGYGPDIPRLECPYLIRIADDGELTDDDTPTYSWKIVNGSPEDKEVSRILGHCSGGLTLSSCIAYH